MCTRQSTLGLSSSTKPCFPFQADKANTAYQTHTDFEGSRELRNKHMEMWVELRPCRGPREDSVLREDEYSGTLKLSPGGQIRLVEADGSAAGATPGTVGVSSQKAVSAAWVQAAVGYRHLHHAGMGGCIQQPLHSQTRRVRGWHRCPITQSH